MKGYKPSIDSIICKTEMANLKHPVLELGMVDKKPCDCKNGVCKNKNNN